MEIRQCSSRASASGPALNQIELIRRAKRLSLQKHIYVDVKRVREFAQAIDREVFQLSLDLAYVCTMDAGKSGEVLLRYSHECSLSSKILRNYCAQFGFSS